MDYSENIEQYIPTLRVVSDLIMSISRESNALTQPQPGVENNKLGLVCDLIR
jgi:hypothetical protein